MGILKRNIIALYIIKIAKWFMLFMPIIVLFYQENGLGLRDVLTLQAVYSIAVIALEIPSGYLADVWGRKKTIILGAIFGTIGFVIYSFTSGFYEFLAAELVLGFAQSFISGSDSALLYDSLKNDNKENYFIKYEGRVLAVGNFAETIAALVGGFLAEISLRTPFYCQTIVAFVAIPAAFCLKEPAFIKSDVKMGFKHILSIVRFSLFKSKNLSYNILLSAIIGCATLTMAWFLQAYLCEIQGFSKYQIGIAWAIVNLTVGIATIFAYKIEKTIGNKMTILLILLVISGSYIVLGLTDALFVFVVIWLFYIFRGIATPILKDYINRSCTPDIRATVLSVRNFVIRILFSVFGPFVGWYADVFSLQQAFLISGILILSSGLIVFLVYFPLLRKNRKA
ncbi:MAG TPA: MFS transporter [Bacteroidales bacterium]|nr:MFS transporter [Bacteroidales bacterium]